MDKYIFDPRGYILLSGLEFLGLPDSIKVEGYELYKKREFHITLIGAKALEYLDGIADPVDAMRSVFNDFAQSHDLTRYTIRNEYRLARYKDRVTVIAMADVDGIDELFTHVNNQFGVNIPTQPAHVTLYSVDPSVGIPLNSMDDVLDYTKIVEISDIRLQD